MELVDRRGSTWVRRGPVGVCALITPWKQPAGKRPPAGTGIRPAETPTVS
ncbi:hypothetical protein [Streptomyces bauhiniae]